MDTLNTDKFYKTENETQEEVDKSNMPNNKPVIKLRSMTTLIDKTKRSQRGQTLKKELKKNLELNRHCVNKKPVVDIFESLANRKLTYSDNEQSQKEKVNCWDIDNSLETSFSSARFGKVYPSASDKCHASTGKHHCDLADYSSSQVKDMNCEDIDIPVPLKKNKIKFKGGSNHSFETANHVSSIFGKVYVKKSPNDMSFFRKTTELMYSNEHETGERYRSDKKK